MSEKQKFKDYRRAVREKLNVFTKEHFVIILLALLAIGTWYFYFAKYGARAPGPTLFDKDKPLKVVFFDVGQSVLKPEGRTELDKVEATPARLQPDLSWNDDAKNELDRLVDGVRRRRSASWRSSCFARCPRSRGRRWRRWPPPWACPRSRLAVRSRCSSARVGCAARGSDRRRATSR